MGGIGEGDLSSHLPSDGGRMFELPFNSGGLIVLIDPGDSGRLADRGSMISGKWIRLRRREMEIGGELDRERLLTMLGVATDLSLFIATGAGERNILELLARCSAECGGLIDIDVRTLPERL
jgi:hypothetical protein